MTRQIVDLVKLFVMVMLFISLAPALALVPAGQMCVRRPTDDFRDIIAKAKVSKKDTRYGIIEGGREFGLSVKQVAQYRNSIGFVFCYRKDDTTKGRMSSAAIVGKANQLLMAAHAAMKQDDGIDRDNCFFQTRSDPPTRVKLNLSKAKIGPYQPGTVFKDGDYAIVNLGQALPGTRPIPVSKDAGKVKVTDSLYIISAQQQDMARRIGTNEPIIQNCEVTSKGSLASTSLIVTNCSGTPGASGSLALKKNANGELEAVGMMIISTKKDAESGPNDEDNSEFILFDGKLDSLGT